MTTLVKICGLSTPETLQAALEARADFVGFVFFPKSPRNVLLRQAASLAAQARGRARVVTLVVDAEDALLTDIAEAVKPDLIQAHGSETPERLARIRLLTGIPAYKALRVRNVADVAKAVSTGALGAAAKVAKRAPAPTKAAARKTARGATKAPAPRNR